MCTETFLRLPEEKRRRFLDAAWEEFSTVRFVDVSINQIVRRAGIPRGSFYQYFAGKDDLFAYLLEEVRNHVKEEYRRVLRDNGGDIFQAQLDCFDRMSGQDLSQDPVMERCMLFVKNNQGVDIQKLLPTRPGQRLLDGLWDVIDFSGLREPTQDYCRIVFCLLMAALGSAFMDAMLCPEDRALHRRELAAKLEIVRHGSLA
ncbi:TetR/AcrR family transcriptional regulator [uncultured Oscillibacter sp.]|uniref:TetR/AcrR family transcriptional regulator n=1 Tax=uncultured Oscillibacter sp. TaxID=876091 RepID=UPI00261381FE|nr:TetR/AcrR family transcriptional regulator [uncultured Oscillibacter sp.]